MSKLVIFAVIFMFILGCNDASQDATTPEDNTTKNATVPPVEPIIEEIAWGNAKCPVMPEDNVDKEISIEYQGKKLHFCCEKCIKKFKDNPEKYHETLVKMTAK